MDAIGQYIGLFTPHWSIRRIIRTLMVNVVNKNLPILHLLDHIQQKVVQILLSLHFFKDLSKFGRNIRGQLAESDLQLYITLT